MALSTTRRALLLATGIGLAAATGVSVLWRTSKAEDLVTTILNKRLGQLNIEQNHFKAFSIDYMAHRQQYSHQMRLFSALGIFSIMTPYALLPMEHPLRKLENNIVSQFLLSTDFFQNQGNTERSIQYLGYYDPYTRPCSIFFG